MIMHFLRRAAMRRGDEPPTARPIAIEFLRPCDFAHDDRRCCETREFIAVRVSLDGESMSRVLTRCLVHMEGRR